MEKAPMAFSNLFKAPTKAFPARKIAPEGKRVIPRIAGTLHVAGAPRIGGK
jgi:hypothetical protein